MNPYTTLFLILATLLVMAAVMTLPADAETNCTTTCQTVWGQTQCRTRCD
jgi:hypothetical protein